MVGVRTTDGEELRADLVVDCGGRRSALPDWLEALGARRPQEEVDDSGFIYFGRHFRSRDGQLPVALGPGLQPYGSISAIMLPCDNDTWAVTLVARSGDRALLGLKDTASWDRTVRALPTVAHWLDGDPIEDRIVTMAKIEDAPPGPPPHGVPVATGVVAVADAWACTNPSWDGGRPSGCCMPADFVTRCARPAPTNRPATRTPSPPPPRPSSSLGTGPHCRSDRHRLAEMSAVAEGTIYDPGDPVFEMSRALALASSRDPDAFRAFLAGAMVLELPEVALARPGLFDKVVALGAGWRDEPEFGPDRATLVALANA